MSSHDFATVPSAGPVTPLLELRAIGKSFGSARVLREAGLTAHPGEVTALVGENGAGKSTLVKCVSGVHRIDSGEFIFDGARVEVSSPRDAAALGIDVVHQDLALCDNLDVAENMFLGRERRGTGWRAGRLDHAAMEEEAARTLRTLAARTLTSVRRPVAGLSGGQRQTVAIARALLSDSRLVILDEPTAALGVAQTRQVLETVRRLADQGLAVVLISHNMNDVFAVADRIVVLYMGRTVAQVAASEVTHQQLVQLISTGRGTPSPA